MAQPHRPRGRGHGPGVAQVPIDEAIPGQGATGGRYRSGPRSEGLRIGEGPRLAPGLRPDRQAPGVLVNRCRIARATRYGGAGRPAPRDPRHRRRVAQGYFRLGSQESYLSTMLPVLHKALEKKGYLPYRRQLSVGRPLDQGLDITSSLTVSERLGANYLSSENRLTRIEARLVLTSRNTLIWQTIPTALTPVPLPGLTPICPVVSPPVKNVTRKSSGCSTRTPRPHRGEIRLRPHEYASLPLGGLSENQVVPDRLTSNGRRVVFEFSGKTTLCHIKNRRNFFLKSTLILGQASSHLVMYHRRADHSHLLPARLRNGLPPYEPMTKVELANGGRFRLG